MTIKVGMIETGYFSMFHAEILSKLEDVKMSQNNAIRTGDSFGILSNYEDAYRTHKVTLAALESAVTGSSEKVK